MSGGGVFYLPDGRWFCTQDNVKAPCGNCDGCRYVAQVNASMIESDHRLASQMPPVGAVDE